jgi:hypothetical protein
MKPSDDPRINRVLESRLTEEPYEVHAYSSRGPERPERRVALMRLGQDTSDRAKADD